MQKFLLTRTPKAARMESVPDIVSVRYDKDDYPHSIMLNQENSPNGTVIEIQDPNVELAVCRWCQEHHWKMSAQLAV